MSKKGENIYKRKDGRWEARYIKGRRTDGNAQYGYCYAKTYSEAKEKAMKLKANVLCGGTIPNGDRIKRLSVYCDEWLKLKRSKVKESTYVKYNSALQKYIKPLLGGYFPEEVTQLLAEQFGYSLMNEYKLSAKTVKDLLIVLSSVLKYISLQVSGFNKFEMIYPKCPKKEMRVLSPDEQKRFITFLSTDTDLCKFGTLLSLLTGLRLGEICALKWENISFTEKTISVLSTMQRIKDIKSEGEPKTKILIDDPKSFSSNRVIPLNQHALQLCKRFYNSHPGAYVLTDTSSYMEPRALQYRMKQYATACNLDGVHFHTLRHSFATRCVEVGFEIKSLSEILGHASPQITLERYVHSSLELKRKNMDKLDVIGF